MFTLIITNLLIKLIIVVLLQSLNILKLDCTNNPKIKALCQPHSNLLSLSKPFQVYRTGASLGISN